MTQTPVAHEPGTGHAVVIGASMAGLLAARVLAGHVDRVTVVERDRLPDGAGHRKGVPQGRHLHVLLPAGLAVLDRLFPGFGRELQAAGAVPFEAPRELAMLTSAGWLDRRGTAGVALSASRPLVEDLVRRRLLELPGVAVLDGHEATALAPTAGGRSVRGVALRRVDGGIPSTVDADLVVDASGRGSRTPVWLAELGFPAPRTTQIDSHVAYASRIYRIPDGFAADWKAVMLMARPPENPRTGYLFPIEGGRWIVSLTGAAGQHPPTDEEGFAAFARSLPSPIVAEAVAEAEPVTDIRGHRGTANRRWHVEWLPRWPERLVVLGDAVCAFNPIYGQGMSAAAWAAETLDDSLRRWRRTRPGWDLDGFSRQFQQRLARRVADPWTISSGEDLRYPTTTGSSPGPALRAQHRYLDRVVEAATTDPAVAVAWIRVLGMLDRPTALFRPRIVAAAIRSGRVRQRPAASTAGVPAPRTPAEQQQEVRA
jgi:2-polyprenyl-6-methoxyphenol hydroxylase-like FAD-dependent oxidoreductase